MKKFVITGAPNAGKTTIVDELSKKGYAFLSETSRILIDTQKIFPWDNQELFCEEFRKLQIMREAKLEGDIIFLDQSLVDPLAYAAIDECSINPSIYDDIRKAKYENDVFFLEMLSDYSMDQERLDTRE